MSRDEGTEAAHQPEQAAAINSRPKWTIMVYLAGDNNLSANSLSVLQQLEAANLIRGGDVRVVACFDANTPRPRGARYMEIKHGRFENPPNPKTSWGLHNDLVPFRELKKAGIQPVVSPSFCDSPCEPVPTQLPDAKDGLSRFLKFALKFHKADRFMLILYGHGTAVAGNTFLADDNPPSFLRLKDFAEVLREHFDVRHDEEQRADWKKSGGDDESASRDESGYNYKPALDVLACDNCIMNGIESSYEVKGQVKYILGSQGLALAVGWPFRKIVNAVIRHRDSQTERVAQSLLRVCARNLIDFTLMDRSSEQSVCDLTKLQSRKNLVTAVNSLSKAMQQGLKVYEYEKDLPEGKNLGEVIFPAVRDAIKLARLEAQSYWSEVFVDLYDFCALLLEKCNENLYQLYGFYDEFVRKDTAAPAAGEGEKAEAVFNPRATPVMEIFGSIARACKEVTREILIKKFVLRSYYIGPALQYSNGVSVYFPWNLPERPVIFEPADENGNCTPAGSYGISWTGLDKLVGKPQTYTVKTAFDEYTTYNFAKPTGGDWAKFLVSFFKATLRDVRRFDYCYVESHSEKSRVFFDKEIRPEEILVDPSTIDLQKTGSDNDSEEDCTCPDIKNYPRRFYISPADCKRRCPVPNAGTEEENAKENSCHSTYDPTYDPKYDSNADTGDKSKHPCVSYLGWNIRGLVAQVIHLKEDRREEADARLLAVADELEEFESNFDEIDSDESEAENPRCLEEDDDETGEVDGQLV